MRRGLVVRDLVIEEDRLAGREGRLFEVELGGQLAGCREREKKAERDDKGPGFHAGILHPKGWPKAVPGAEARFCGRRECPG